MATGSVIATGIVFIRCTPDLYEAHKAALEIDGFPVVGSLKVSGVDKGLAKAAIERTRLMKLYRTSKDTKAIMALFMYGAYKFSRDGMGQSIFPPWYTGQPFEKVLDILCKECLPKAKANGTVSVDLSPGAKKVIAFPVIGAQLQHRPKFFAAIPTGLVKGSIRDDKPEVVYRVTLCWTNAPSSSAAGSVGGTPTGGSSSSDAPAAIAMPWHYHDGNGYRHLVLEHMDWGQSEAMSESRRRLPYECDFALSIYLGESSKKHPSIFSADAENF